MKRVLVGAVVALALLTCLSMRVQAGGQDFRLFNRTGVDIASLYVAPSDTEDWQEDILGKDMLPNGGELDITFDRDETAEKWDLKVTDREGNFLYWRDLNLLQISQVILEEDGTARCK
jgi:hypothetical protein